MDLADLWRGALSVRRLSVLIDALPPESHCAAAVAGTTPGWSVEALVSADTYAALTGQPHPARPQPRSSGRGGGDTRAASLRARLNAQRDRLAQKRAGSTE